MLVSLFWSDSNSRVAVMADWLPGAVSVLLFVLLLMAITHAVVQCAAGRVGVCVSHCPDIYHLAIFGAGLCFYLAQFSDVRCGDSLPISIIRSMPGCSMACLQ